VLRSNLVRGGAAVLLAATATAASAQDYAVSSPTGRWIDPPVGAVDLLPQFASRLDASRTLDTLPFPVSYFGRPYASMSVSTNGFVQFGGGASGTPSVSVFPQGASEDGVCAVAWSQLDATVEGAQILVWTDGAAPSRRFVVSWTNFHDSTVPVIPPEGGPPTDGRVSAQVQFHEDSGRVVFAYSSNYNSALGAVCGLDAVTSSATGNDPRYQTPDASGLYMFSGRPSADFQFDPVDDSDEPNAGPDEAVALGDVGALRTNRTLLLDDEDWYSFHVDASGPVTVDVSRDPAFVATLTLEIRTLGGAILASGSQGPVPGLFRVTAASVPAGDYLVRLKHDGGRALPVYAIQAYSRFTLTSPSVTTWTAGRAFTSPVAVGGGVGAYTIVVDPYTVLPPGVVFDAANMRLVGTPSVPGRYEFVWKCADSGSPANTASLLQTVVVNPALDIRFGDYVAFAQGKSAARAIPATGGTAPLSWLSTSGATPNGVSVDSATSAFVGVADTLGSFPFGLSASDALGSTDEGTTTAVVCAPVGTAFSLGEGASAAAGVWFDAALGSTVKLSISTQKGAAKRPLHATLLAADGTTTIAATWKLKLGKADLAGFVAPTSGRYYVVVSGDAGAATELLSKTTIAAPKKGAGKTAAMSSGEQVSVKFGALAGAKLTFTAKPANGLVVRIQSLLDPTGAAVSLDAADVRLKGTTLTLNKILGASGTWTIVLAGSQGGPGTVAWNHKLGLPRGASYSAE
jgi:hypothetical protein